MLNRIGCLATLVFWVLTPHATAEIINVADHGIVPGKDVTLEVSRLIESIGDKDGVTLRFPKGQYDFHPDNAVEQYRAVANHDNGLKRFGFPLFNCQNVTIDGGGSTFLFHGRMVPVTIERTRGVVLQNFTIDWERSGSKTACSSTCWTTALTFTVRMSKSNST